MTVIRRRETIPDRRISWPYQPLLRGNIGAYGKLGAVVHSQTDYEEAVSSPDWGSQVVEELRRYFGTGGWLMEPVVLISAHLEVGADGGSVLVAIYDHSGYRDRLGYRRPLDRPPYPLVFRDSPAESQAESIARYEISEPIAPADGSSVTDANGVRWWTDPHIVESPDAPWFAGLPLARWRRFPGPWTIARNEALCGSLAVADGPILQDPTVLMPPKAVHCVRPAGHSGVHGSASRPAQPGEGAGLEVLGWE